MFVAFFLNWNSHLAPSACPFCPIPLCNPFFEKIYFKWVSFVRVSKHLESLYGSEWKEKVSPASSSVTTESLASQAAVNGSPSHRTETKATATPQSTPKSSTISSATATQPSPPVDVSGSTSSPAHPSPVTNGSTVESQAASGESTVDPAVRFAQCKEEGNSFVKQVSFRETNVWVFNGVDN